MGNDTWVRGHEGPIVKGIIRQENKMSVVSESRIVINGSVDEDYFEFVVYVVCSEDKGGLVCF